MKYSGIEWIGDIPEEWKTLRIQFCLDEIVEKNDPIQTTQILSLMKDRGVMLYDEKGDIGNKAKEDCSEYKIAYPNTLIVNSMNILIGSVGISNYFGCVSPVYYVFKETNLSELRFVNYIFNTTAFQKELRRYANGILEIRLRISSNNIFKRKIPLPNKIMQIKIADFLDDKCVKIDNLIAHEQVMIEELKAYKQSVITEAVTKGLDKSVLMKDSGVEWIGKIPESWSISKIKMLADETQENAFIDGDWIESPYIEDTGIRYLTTGNIGDGVFKRQGNGFISNETFTKLQCKYAYPQDLIFSRLNEEYGRSCILPNDYDKYVIAVDNVILRTNEDKKYICYVTQCSNYHKAVFFFARGTAMKRISRTNLGNVAIPLPSIAEQQQIAEYLDNKCADIDSLISIKQQKIEELKEYKKSLIYEYVTGKKEVA